MIPLPGVLVDGTTASSAEILAALLRQRAGAKIVGKRTFGKDYLLHAIPVSHDLELVVPGKQVVILGETMRGVSNRRFYRGTHTHGSHSMPVTDLAAVITPSVL